MYEEMLVRYCSPTLAGLKTGNIFAAPFDEREEVFRKIRTFNRRFRDKDIRMIPLRIGIKRALIYVYRPKKLIGILESEAAFSLLKELGYDPNLPQKCIGDLIRRINFQKDFPHEIGLFLGYPPEDVRGFMKKDCPPKCTGFWKVYGDAAGAQKLFLKYKKCTDCYLKYYKISSCIERLVV